MALALIGIQSVAALATVVGLLIDVSWCLCVKYN